MMSASNVANGLNASISDNPFSAFIFVKKQRESYIGFYGGSILTDMIILTVAHMVSNKAEIYVGNEDLEKVTVRRNMKRNIKHEAYNSKTHIHDIALILLDSPLPLGKNIQRVLITPKYPYAKVVRMASWATTNPTQTNKHSRFLQYMVQKVVRFPGCQIEGTFCTKNIKPDKGRISTYDSGSAMISGKNQQIGIANNNLQAKVNRRSNRRLMVCQNATYYYEWIKKTSSKLCKG